jgi:hypothetical protein
MKIIKLTHVAVFVIGLISIFAMAAAQAAAPDLFSNPKAVTATSKGERSRNVRAAMPVQQGAGQQRGFAASSASTSAVVQSITLNLFDDTSFVAVLDRLVQRSEKRYTWFGHIQDQQNTNVILVINNGRITGQVEINGQTYTIRATKDGGHQVIELGPQDFQIDEGGVTPDDAGADTSSYDAAVHTFAAAAETGAAAGDTQIYILVVYTADAAEGASGDIADEIQLAMDVTNQTFVNSQITAQVNIVHSYQTDFVEDTDNCNKLSTYLTNLKGANDGDMDDVHALRNQYNADVVSLWVEDGCTIGGRGYIMSTVSGGFEDSAFHVVTRKWASSNYVFTHELGHNMSARHDREVDNSNGNPFDYNHGYTDISNTFRTIMAYNDACTSADTSCPRIAHWSNPDVNFTTTGGVTATTGIAEGDTASNNARAINNTKDTMASFRENGSCSGTNIDLVVDSPVNAATVRLNDTVTFSARVTLCTQPISDATVTVTNTNISDITLYDDGTNGDATANDGTYTNAWSATLAGNNMYTIRANRTGSNQDSTTRWLEVENGSDFPAGGAVPASWTNGTNAWVVDTDTKQTGWHSLRSGDIGDNQDSIIEYTADFEGTTIWGVSRPAKVIFWYKVSSEDRYDFLRFYIDGELKDSWAGEVDWTKAEYELADGEHTIRWVYHKDQSVGNGSDAAWIDEVELVGVVSNVAPTLSVTSPTDGASYTFGNDIAGSATASDKEDGDISANINWMLDAQGVVATGASATFSDLTVGDHSLTINIKDSGGRSTTFLRTFTVVDPASNTAPTVNVTAPTNNSSYEAGSSVTFTATASDDEDGDLASSISWSSSVDGSLGTGETINTSSLTVGTHTVTASVTDSASATSTATVAVVINTAPTLSDIASLATATASEQYSSSYAAAEINDGDTNEFWASEYNPGDVWVQLEWSDTQTIRQLGINWHSSYMPGNLVVQARLGGGWVAQTSSQSANSSGDTVSLNVTTDAIRVLLSNRSGNFYGIRELTVNAETNSAPTVGISAPTNNTNIIVGNSLTFTATANDVEDGSLSSSITWSSSIDGSLGTGNSISANLSIGTHTVTASVSDSNGTSGAATVSVTVNAVPNIDPTVSISSPSYNTTITEGDSLSFTATAADDEDGDISTNIVWTSSIDGALGTGGTITTNLTDGAHTITATITDSASSSVSASITVNVTALPNTDPTISISAPTNNTNITAGDSLTFTATASDEEDGDISANIIWTSDIDNNLGTGGSISYNLSVGSHTITSSITDSDGSVATSTIGITVTAAANTDPTISISNPTNNAQFTQGSNVSFTGSAADNEDGDITADMTWSSNIDGNIGTGGSVSASNLSAGTHSITASITDSNGANSMATITVIINAQSNVNIAPQATINASSSYSDSYAASNANDEDNGSFWASRSVSSGSSAWVQLIWNGSKQLSEMTIDWHSSYYARDFKVYAYVNGSWVDQTGTVTGSSSGNTISLNANTTKVYISMTQSSGGFYGIREIVVK